MDLSSVAAQLGSLGGKKTKETHSIEEYRKWQALSVKKRLKNKKRGQNSPIDSGGK